MDKLEKVIKAWECCNPLNRRCFECPYDADCFHDSFDRVAIADMAILLKEQQEKIDGLLEDLATAIDDKDSALMMLKEQQAEINKLNGFINGFSRDAVPVIRCKDCRHYEALTESCNDGIDGIMLPEFYCGNAEPKDGEQ